jgi:alkylhydroperoxidase family enzyme
MPRLPEVARADADPFVIRLYDTLFAGRDPVSEPGTATGTLGNWWTVFAQSPDTFKHAVAGFQYYRSPARKLDPQLRELGQMRVGWAGGSQFVFSQHCKAARSVKLSEAKIEAVPHWQVSDVFSPLERAVLAYADALSTANGRVADGVFETLRAHLDAETIVELTYIVSLYAMHATMARALRLEYDDRPDPIVEIAAPEGFDPDVMAMVDRKE